MEHKHFIALKWTVDFDKSPHNIKHSVKIFYRPEK